LADEKTFHFLVASTFILFPTTTSIMKSKTFFFLTLLTALASKQLFGHCQVPCGVYTDQLRFEQMLEDQTTIEKASKLITELSDKEDALSHQQLSRWVATKEAHATNIQKIIAEYFMIQRIKATDKDYETQLKGAHAVMVAAMKCKQNLDAEHSKKLKESILSFHKGYEKK
tara:strand:- start:55 stop:567 length:513 start_codon:yes stop_codon:yes gene_type:complete